ncbi:hypothetical protein Q8G71_35825, partial [Klebsiella pneumoniae]
SFLQLYYPEYLEFPAFSNPIVGGLCNFHPSRVSRKLYDPMFKQKMIKDKQKKKDHLSGLV